MTDSQFLKASGTVAVVGFVTAVVLAICYWMKLSIFTRATLEWCFVLALVAAGVGIVAIAVSSIWERNR